MNEKQTIQKKKIKFPIAAVFFTIESVFLLLDILLEFMSLNTFISVIALIIFTIILYCKKINTLSIISLSIFTLTYYIKPIIDSVDLLSYDSEMFFIIFIIILIIQLIKISSSVLLIMILKNKLKSNKNSLKKLWFLPGILMIIGEFVTLISVVSLSLVFSVSVDLIFSIFVYLIFSIFADSVFTYLVSISVIIGYFLLGYWLANPYEKEPNEKSNYTNTKQIRQNGYIDLAKHVLLLLFTFGIWHLIWIYRTTRFLNTVKGEEYRDPTNKLLLCMFVPFYSIYWIYKSALSADKLARENGVSSDISTLCLVLAIFVGIVPPILIQSKINETVTSYPNKKTDNSFERDISDSEKKTGFSNKSEASMVASELKQYKELLDSGILTQEEFEQKKKELL